MSTFTPKQRDKICRHILSHLERFRLAVEFGKTQGSAILGKAHPAVGKAVEHLEVTLRNTVQVGLPQVLNDDATLLKHVSGKEYPTEAGTAFLRFIDHVNLGLETLNQELMAIAKDDKLNVISIATLHQPWAVYGEKLKAEFKRRMPSHELSPLYFPNTTDIIEQVKQRRAKVGIISVVRRRNNRPQIPLPLQHKEWLHEQMVLVFSKKHHPQGLEAGPLAQTVQHLNSGAGFLRMSNNTSAIRVMVDHYLERIGLELKSFREELEAIDQIKSSIIAEDRISILPKPCVQGNKQLGIYDLYPEMEKRNLYILYREDTLVTHTIEKLIESFQQVAETHKADR